MEALWQSYAHQFPVRERLIYLQHAGVAPLSKPAADAMRRLTEDCLLHGSLHYDDWLAAYEGLRAAAARLIHCDPAEIAIVKNTSEGISMVATGLRWRPGDRIVAFTEEFPSNYLPWKKLEQHGVVVEWLSVDDPLERIERAARGARLLALSFVQYLSGRLADLVTVGDICARAGCIFLVDAIQGLGAYPLDVRTARIGALAADGHKWLLGPEGCGILYVERGLQDQIEPVEFGWTNVANFDDFANRDLTLRPDAGRYECGTLNTVGCFGLRASIEFLSEVGIGRVAAALDHLRERLLNGLHAKGYEVLGRPGAGIVSFRKAGVDSRAIVRRLKEHGMITAPRQGWVRASPHFYVSPEEIDSVLNYL